MIRCLENCDLSSRNSFGVSVRAAGILEFGPAEELLEFLAENPKLVSGRWAVLGGGNNILFTRDYDGTLLHPVTQEIRITSESDTHVRVNVTAGHDWDAFVMWCVGRGLWGVENLSHIPSLVGAAPVQNIGAYGAEAKDAIESVEAVHIATGKVNILAAEHCAFGYRDSVFKHELAGKAVITSVNFRLSKAPRPNTEYGALRAEADRLGGQTLANIRQAVINIRGDKLPDPAMLGNAGSFFKNPVVATATAEAIGIGYPDMPQYPCGIEGHVKLSAGWLIDKAGLKGYRQGNVGVYEKQALIIVNHGGATGAEIVAFAEMVRGRVREKFGITIEPEVNIW